MRAVGWKIGLAPGLGVAYHNSAVVVCDNGDLLAAYYNTPKEENDPDQSIVMLRLRYGAEDWEMPELWPDFPMLRTRRRSSERSAASSGCSSARRACWQGRRSNT